MKRTVLYLFVLALALPALVAAGEKVECPLVFADFLFQNGDYYRAITEYERIRFVETNAVLRSEVEFKIASCYMRGGRLEEARLRFETIMKEPGGMMLDAQLALAEVWYRLKDFNKACLLWSDFARKYPDDPRAASARVKQAVCYLHFGNRDWAQSVALSVSNADERVQSAAKEVEQAARAYEHIPVKSPGMAALLSAGLPGAGQLYVEQPQSALAAFMLNAICIGGAVAAYRNDEDAAGTILSIVGVSWYVGTIAHAVNSTQKYNQRQREHFFDSLELEAGLWSSAGRINPEFSLVFRF